MNTQVGPDDAHFDDTGRFTGDVIYWYEQGSYEGEGIAIERLPDDTFQEWDLGHCSCYGPADHCEPVPIGPDVVFNMVDSIGRERVPADSDYAMWKALCAAAMNLWAKPGEAEARP